MFLMNHKVPTNSHHATSHANMSTFANTPINRKTFTSATVNGSSSRIDSDKKYKYPSYDIIFNKFPKIIVKNYTIRIKIRVYMNIFK